MTGWIEHRWWWRLIRWWPTLAGCVTALWSMRARRTADERERSLVLMRRLIGRDAQ